jgi:hypothetical protein
MILGWAYSNNDKWVERKLGIGDPVMASVTWVPERYDITKPNQIPLSIQKQVPVLYINQIYLAGLVDAGYPRFDEDMIKRVINGAIPLKDNYRQIDALVTGALSHTLAHEVSISSW